MTLDELKNELKSDKTIIYGNVVFLITFCITPISVILYFILTSSKSINEFSLYILVVCSVLLIIASYNTFKLYSFISIKSNLSLQEKKEMILAYLDSRNLDYKKLNNNHIEGLYQVDLLGWTKVNFLIEKEVIYLNSSPIYVFKNSTRRSSKGIFGIIRRKGQNDFKRHYHLYITDGLKNFE